MTRTTILNRRAKDFACRVVYVSVAIGDSAGQQVAGKMCIQTSVTRFRRLLSTKPHQYADPLLAHGIELNQ
jgi:hypothetical protein